MRISVRTALKFLIPPDFQGAFVGLPTLQKLKCFTSHPTLSRNKFIPGTSLMMLLNRKENPLGAHNCRLEVHFTLPFAPRQMMES